MSKSPYKQSTVTPAGAGRAKSITTERATGAGDGKPRINSKTGEVGGPEGPEPTRYGDWEKNGRCIDF